MYCERFHKDHPDVLLFELSEGADFKLDLASSKVYRVLNSVYGEVYDSSNGIVRRFPPYWWVYIFF